DITIDFNGYSIISTNPPGGASPVAVRISEATNIVVRNGQTFGFDRAIRAEGAFYGVGIDNIHPHRVRRADFEGNGVSGDPTPTFYVRNSIVDVVDGTGEGANVSVDGIVVLNCSGLVDNCVVRDIIAAGTGASTCINASFATNTFINNNYMANGDVGLRISGGGSRVYYRNNLTAGCGTPFVSSGGVDRGGNN